MRRLTGISGERARGRRLTLEALEARLPLDASMLRITEFVASNDNGLQDYDGFSADWLEVFNAGNETVDLSGMYLTDNADNLTKWAFPSGVTLPAGGYRIVFASSKDTVKPNGELHANFALSAGGEYLGLIDADGTTIIDQYAPDFPAQIEDVGYGRSMAPTGGTTTLIAAGAASRSWVPTSSVLDAIWKNVSYNAAAFNITGPTGLGYENNPGDGVNFTAEIATTVPSNIRSLYTRITFNLTTLTGIDRLTLRMKYDDGFIAYVNGMEVAEDNAPEGAQWDSQTNSTRPDADAEIFRDFDVSPFISQLRLGENVLAIHGLNQYTGSDMLILPELVATASVIVAPEEFGYFAVPTPGYGNGESVLGFIDEPIYSVPHGFYETAQNVALSATTPGAVIVYTTDGSTPAVDANLAPTNGTLYTGPINVNGTTTLRAMAFKTDFKPSFIASNTYLFLSDILNQSPQGQVPAGWAPNGVNGQTMDYGMDPQIIALYGAQAVKDSLLSLSSISITTDLANLFDPVTGIYVNAHLDGRTSERPASAELIHPDGTPGFNVNAGLRIRGGYSRGDFNPKHAFRLYFRGEYGDGKLNYPLFGDEGADEFDVMDLRTEQNYAWSSEGNTQNSFVREVFGRDLQADLGDEYTRSRYYHLYVDGVYFGIYQTQERVEEFYGETYFGGKEEDYDIVKQGLNDGGGTLVNAGNDLAWNQLFNLAQNLANNPAANANNYWTMQGLNPDGTRNAALPVLLDVDNLVNYMLTIFYTGGYDSGLSRFLGDNEANNWYGIYNRVDADVGFHFFIHDNEHSLGAEGSPHGSQFIDRTGPFNNGNQSNYRYFNPHYLHQDLLSHPEYRMQIVEKVQQYFFSGGPMTPAASIARMNERVAEVGPAIIAEAARWGDAKVGVPRNKTTWQNEINWLLGVYFPNRTNTVLNQLRADGLHVATPTFSHPGGVVPNEFALTLSAAGAIYYTTDGLTDPRLVGGGVNPSSAVNVYTGAIPLSGNVTIRARARTAAGDWSTLVEATYSTTMVGDYDGNSLVDGADFLLWQRNLGATASPAGSGADGDVDGIVDAGDLTAWASHFGDGAPAAEAFVVATSTAADAASLDAASLDAAFTSLTGAFDFKLAAEIASGERQAASVYAKRREIDFGMALRGASPSAAPLSYDRPGASSILSEVRSDDAGCDEAQLDDALATEWSVGLAPC